MTSPHIVAEKLIAEAPSEEWLRALLDDLHRELETSPLRRLLSVWDLSAAEAARMFGVTRQAFSRWLRQGPPADRRPAIADLDVATTTLERYLHRDRIPAVVRRQAPKLGGRSLLEIALAGEHESVREHVGRMFDLRRVQP